jgi:SseB protein C-terminal domain
MKWLKQMLGHSNVAEVLIQPDIQFLGEQDGSPEQTIKARWLPIFSQNTSVQSAFLAIVSFDRAATYHPALCIRSSLGDDSALIEKLAAAFKEVFAGSQMLDIMFVTNEQEAQIRKVCRPFYEMA